MPHKSDSFLRRTLSFTVFALPLTLCFGTVAFGQGQGDGSSVAANNQRLTAEHDSAVRAADLPPVNEQKISDDTPSPSSDSPPGVEPPVLDGNKRPIAMTPAEELAAKNHTTTNKGGASLSSAPKGDMLTRLLDRVNDQEDRIRTLQGSVDVLQKQVDTMQAGFDKRLGDLKFQMTHQSSSSDASSPAPAPAHEPSKAADDSFAGLMSSARQAKSQKNYKKAETLSRQALDKAPAKGKLDAQYLLAQSLAGEKVWSKAAVAYYDSYKLSPKSSVAPHALFGTAQAMHALGDKQAACEALSKLTKEFPNAASSFKTEVSKTQTQYQCS
ncbi:tetratricopeptide repeat protein [Acetobacteraceae bacterium]|nr:tetratricopeptide repeat protein [Acetobacteraceae bacterium]